ncbi:Hypothetical Protein FCC1311_030512 [Hondaea fermentalgiana]|uniref:Uncharacterized protein n=1 Tax=Hondaea fermentalgiana TaxID=2315210 RepID=A0A2R5G918_9STRA|nr:Hypothetical Protein FCC1311_030512 [Hondaea fermentalgiana]|eukprot:GBG26829.1 Hypothetical Protein FCC1311_030512 [Hondaea fermentalgiana]
MEKEGKEEKKKTTPSKSMSRRETGTQPRQLSQPSPPSPTPATITSCSTTAILNRTMKARRPVVSAAKNKSRPIESAANIMNARAISMAVAFMQRHDLSIENFAREVNVAGPALEMWLFNGIDDPASTVTRTVKQYMLEESEFEYHLATQENCENLRATLSRPLHVKHDAFAASIQTLHYIWFGSSEDYIKDGSIVSTPGTGKGWNLHKFRTRSFHPGENKLERMFYLETKRCCATFLDRRNKSLGEEAYSKALSRGRNGLKRILNALRGRLREDADPLRPVCLLLATTLSFVEYCDLLVGHHSSIIAETWDHIMSTWREVFYCITTDRFVPTFSPVTFTVKTSEPPLWNCLQDVIETLDNALGAMEARQGRYKWTFATFKDITDPVRRWLTVIIS